MTSGSISSFAAVVSFTGEGSEKGTDLRNPQIQVGNPNCSPPERTDSPLDYSLIGPRFASRTSGDASRKCGSFSQAAQARRTFHTITEALLDTFQAGSKVVVWRAAPDTPIPTSKQRSPRRRNGGGASKRQPVAMPMCGGECSVPRLRERDVLSSSIPPHGTRSRTPAISRNGWTAARTRRTAIKEKSHEGKANV